MIQLEFEIEGEKQLSRRFVKIPQDLGDLTPVMVRIGAELKTAVDQNYKSRGSLFGAKWKPRKDNKTHPLLEKTGKMRAGFKERLGPDYVEIYNTVDYFKYHQSNKPRKKLPRRIMLKLDQVRKTFIVKEFQRHLHLQVTGK